jgi:hypothetical protein
MEQQMIQVAEAVVNSLRRSRCRYVWCGGAALTTFQLALGKDLLGNDERVNREPSEDFPESEGDAALLVWCTWRLDSAERPLSSSNDTQEHAVQALDALTGREILDVKIDMPRWDIHLTFSAGLVLHVFCDHVPGDPSFDGNWELFLRDRTILLGVGSTCEVRAR